MNEAKSLRLQGFKITEIAEMMGKSERTIYKYLSEPPRKRKKREYESLLEPFKPFTDTILEETPDYNRMVLLERLKKQGYKGSITILRDYAAIKTAEINTKAVIRFETEPGFQAQVDWKIHGTRIVDGRKQKLYAFAMVFGYSRAPFVIHTTCMDQATLLACHTLAFSYFGEVPKEVLYDNMKTAFINDSGNWKVNKRLLVFANHYGFIPRRCRVRRPQTKGKVERFIDYYSNNYFLQAKESPLTLTELNEGVLSWIKEINRKHIRDLGESREKRFEHEKHFLISLPETEYNCRTSLKLKVSNESMILYKTNRYSVPPVFIGKTIELQVDPFLPIAEVFCNERFIRNVELEMNNKNMRLFRDEDRKELYELWEIQQFKQVRRKISKTEVITRSPADYEKLTAGGRRVS